MVLLASCSLNKVVQHHGVHNLEKKQAKLKINYTNKNDIIKLIGPPSSKSSFDNDIYIYIERKTSSSKLTKLGRNPKKQKGFINPGIYKGSTMIFNNFKDYLQDIKNGDDRKR